jgi:hypothetical protein
MIGREHAGRPALHRLDTVGSVPAANIEDAFAGYVHATEDDLTALLNFGKFDCAGAYQAIAEINLVEPLQRFDLAAKIRRNRVTQKTIPVSHHVAAFAEIANALPVRD